MILSVTNKTNANANHNLDKDTFVLDDVTYVIDDRHPNQTPNLSHATTPQKNAITWSVIGHYNTNIERTRYAIQHY